MSLSDLQDFLGRRRPLLDLVIQVGGAAAVATALIWVGGVKDRVTTLDREVAQLERTVGAMRDGLLARGMLAPGRSTETAEFTPERH